jgi:hypothetical protein
MPRSPRHDRRDAAAAAVLRGRRRNGATIRPYTEVSGLLVHDGLVSGAVPHDHVTGKHGEVPALSWAATAIGKPALV